MGRAQRPTSSAENTMSASTIELAYQLARSGGVMDFGALKLRLKADGCRAVDALLAPRGLQAHLQAICSATFKAAEDR